MRASDVRVGLANPRVAAVLIAVCPLAVGYALADEPTLKAGRAELAPVAENADAVIRQYPLRHAEGIHILSVLQSLHPAHSARDAYARFAFDKRQNVILAIAAEEKHENIKRLVAMLDEPLDAPPGGGAEPGKAPAAEAPGAVIRQYAIQHVEGNYVVSILRSLYPVYNARVAYVRFAFDKKKNVILAIVAKEHEQTIAKIVAMLDKQLDAPLAGERRQKTDESRSS